MPSHTKFKYTPDILKVSVVSEAVPAGGRGQVVGMLVSPCKGIAAPGVTVDVPNLDVIPPVHVGYDGINGFFD